MGKIPKDSMVIYPGGAGIGSGNGIGRILAMRHPAAVFRSVWFRRNGVSDADWPSAPMLNMTGTKSCALVSVSKTTFSFDVSGESFHVP